MMGHQLEQKDLFSYSVDLDARVHAEHPLRKIRQTLDFGFVREKTAKFYGRNGNESVDPAVIMKLMLLLFLDNVSSERELLRMLPYRIDYLWFIGFGLDDEVPNHSVLSKARRRWGADVFEELFALTVVQCVESGLVDGKKLHMDGSLIDANSARHSTLQSCPQLIAQLRKQLSDEMNKMEDSLGRSHRTPTNSKTLSTTDPDSELVRHGKGQSRFCYKTHRAVDDQCGVITAVETTPGATPENERLMPLVEQHEANTQRGVDTVVADSQYGTNDNLLACGERGIRSHMANVDHCRKNPKSPNELFKQKDFHYNEEADRFICPAGHELVPRQERNGCIDYRCQKVRCDACELKEKCTTSKQGRSLRRHVNQKVLNEAKAQSSSRAAKQDRVRRKWLMEGSFADGANNHGLKRSRWRRLWRQRIQDLMIAAVQNIRKLISRPRYLPAKAEHAQIHHAVAPAPVPGAKKRICYLKYRLREEALFKTNTLLILHT